MAETQRFILDLRLSKLMSKESFNIFNLEKGTEAEMHSSKMTKKLKSIADHEEEVVKLWKNLANSYTKIFRKFEKSSAAEKHKPKKTKKHYMDENIFLCEFRLCIYYRVIEDKLKKITS
jgi:uncharacterized membrane-anchored protein YhcB (DUF1043 family)